MNSQRSLALDLVETDLNDRAAVALLVADHAVAPARRIWSLPAPFPGETPPEALAESARYGYGPGWTEPVPRLVTSTALFDPAVAGFALFARLFPGAIRMHGGLERVLAAPELIYFEDSRQLALFRFEDVERLVDGAFGEKVGPIPHPWYREMHQPVGNRAALGELADAQALVRRVLDAPRPADPPLLNRELIGLRHVDAGAAGELDAVLHSDVHQRAVWLVWVDILIPIGVSARDPDGHVRIAPADDEPLLEQVNDHGVYPTQVPETIRGAVALDLVRTFPRERSIGACGYCARPVVLTPHQVGRVDHGLEVFHPDCAAAHRKRWMRNYQRRRRGGEAMP